MANEINNISLSSENQENLKTFHDINQKYWDNAIKNITVNGPEDTEAASLIDELNNRNTAKNKKRSKKRLDRETKETVTSLFEQLNEAIKQYDDALDDQSLSEHKALLSLKERQAIAGERGGIGLRMQDEISNSSKEYIDDIRVNEEKYKKAAAKTLASLLYKGRIEKAKSLIEEFRNGKKDLEGIKTYLNEYRINI